MREKKNLCYASCPGLEVAVSQRISGNLVLRVLTGMMSMFSLADSFSAQKSQDCIVVGGGNHEKKLMKEILRDIEKDRNRGTEREIIMITFKQHDQNTAITHSQ